MIALPLIVGAATLVASVLVFRLWLGTLPRRICPECGEDTIAVGHPLVRPVGRWVSRRWCAACKWSGWGRRGPVFWARRGPVADGSGFRLGEDRRQPILGFQWKGAERRAADRRTGDRRTGDRRSDERRSRDRRSDDRRSDDRQSDDRRSDERRSGERRSEVRRSGVDRRAPTSHWSVFHFADEGATTETQSDTPSHPSGFRFQPSEFEALLRAHHLSGFSWGDESSTSEPAPKSHFTWGGTSQRKPPSGQGFRWID